MANYDPAFGGHVAEFARELRAILNDFTERLNRQSTDTHKELGELLAQAEQDSDAFIALPWHAKEAGRMSADTLESYMRQCGVHLYELLEKFGLTDDRPSDTVPMSEVMQQAKRDYMRGVRDTQYNQND